MVNLLMSFHFFFFFAILFLVASILNGVSLPYLPTSHHIEKILGREVLQKDSYLFCVSPCRYLPTSHHTQNYFPGDIRKFH